MQGTAADIQRVVHGHRVGLHEVAAESAGHASEQDQEWHCGSPASERLGQSLDWKWGVGVHSAIAFRIGAPRSAKEIFRVAELRHQSIRLVCRRVHAVACSFRSATNSRTSEMEIIGRNRMKRNRSVRNNPMLPKSVAQSQMVGVYIFQLEGTKSR